MRAGGAVQERRLAAAIVAARRGRQGPAYCRALRVNGGGRARGLVLVRRRRNALTKKGTWIKFYDLDTGDYIVEEKHLLQPKEYYDRWMLVERIVAV